jgi:predicted N-acyltransferase
LNVRIHNQITEIPAAAWNTLVRDRHPFLQHQFLAAMERHGCVGERFGWLPRHLAVYAEEALIGAMPLYEKYNSYGEFVFDHAWADAYQRAGLAYFPKLVSAVPYTPANGQRLLARSGREHEVFPALLQTALTLAERIGASGFHCLFPRWEESQYLAEAGLLSRHDCQYHWQNPGYRSFDEFLARLTAKKRKNIRQERRRVADSGVRLRVLDGNSAGERDWQDFSRFYNNTFREKWGMPTFNQGFFQDVATELPDQVVLVLADLDGSCIAGSLMYRSDHTLYGRHWGCDRQVDLLHFEACYYQGIEYCIEQGLRTFEPGAQGEHKIPRGFLPTLTRSSHWLVDARFHRPVTAFVEHEREAVAEHMAGLQTLSPYKQDMTR